MWFCFSGCRRGGDVVELVRLLDQLSWGETAIALSRLTDGIREPSPPVHVVEPPLRPFRPFTRQLPLDSNAPLLAEKGIDPATAAAFGAGAWRRPGFLEGCVAVRLHDPGGQPLGYAGRRLSSRDAVRLGKWKFPPRLPKSRILFNHHRAARRSSQTLAIVECPWGVMRLAQLGLPAVALLGLHLSTAQRRLLERWPSIVLLLDGDDAGRRAVAPLHDELQADHMVRVASLPDGLDPDDLHDSELLRRVIPPWLSAQGLRQ